MATRREQQQRVQEEELGAHNLPPNQQIEQENLESENQETLEEVPNKTSKGSPPLTLAPPTCEASSQLVSRDDANDPQKGQHQSSHICDSLSQDENSASTDQPGAVNIQGRNATSVDEGTIQVGDPTISQEDQAIHVLEAATNLPLVEAHTASELDPIIERIMQQNENLQAQQMEQIQTYSRANKQLKIVVAILVMLVVVAIVVGLLIVMRKDDSTNTTTQLPSTTPPTKMSTKPTFSSAPSFPTSSRPPTDVPSNAPTETPSISGPSSQPADRYASMTTSVLQFYDESISFSDVQLETLSWLVYDDEANMAVDTDPGILLDRFVMALLFLSTDGDNWNTKINWLSSTSVCSWQFLDCDSNDRIRSISLRKYTLAVLSRRHALS